MYRIDVLPCIVSRGLRPRLRALPRQVESGLRVTFQARLTHFVGQIAEVLHLPKLITYRSNISNMTYYTCNIDHTYTDIHMTYAIDLHILSYIHHVYIYICAQHPYIMPINHIDTHLRKWHVKTCLASWAAMAAPPIIIISAQLLGAQSHAEVPGPVRLRS